MNHKDEITVGQLWRRWGYNDACSKAQAFAAPNIPIRDKFG